MKNHHKRPQVLLLGNGLNLAFAAGSISWAELLKEDSPANIPESLSLPFSLEVVLRTGNRAEEKMRAKGQALFGTVDTENQRSALSALLETDFDEILTTNYSYELEETALGLTKISESTLRRLAQSTTGRVDTKYLLHTYNEVPDGKGGSHHIWHIHGEAKKPQSMIIDHYTYGALLDRFVNFARWRKTDYKKYRNYEEIPRESWLDAFFMGDVYILGQGLDFAEMDLWWLIDRKEMDKYSKGHVYYYGPRSDRNYDAKTELLKCYGAEIVDLGFRQPVRPGHQGTDEEFRRYNEARDKVYRDFYLAAIEDIRKRINGRKANRC